MTIPVSSQRRILVWILAGIYAGAQLLQSGHETISPTVFNAIVTFSSFGAALIHGSVRYGWRGITAFAVITIAISNLLENLSVQTGFPFGVYSYSSTLGPRVFDVPIVIGFAYFSVGYFAWVLANIITSSNEQTDGLMDRLFTIVVASFAMVGWDVAMDPIHSTLHGYWIWPTGGSYFGVPLSNFVGWYFTVFVIYSMFSWLISRRRVTVNPVDARTYWYQAPVIFLLCTIPFFRNLAQAHDKVVLDGNGTPWNYQAVVDSALLICTFTMIFVALVTLAQLRRAWRS